MWGETNLAVKGAAGQHTPWGKSAFNRQRAGKMAELLDTEYDIL